MRARSNSESPARHAARVDGLPLGEQRAEILARRAGGLGVFGGRGPRGGDEPLEELAPALKVVKARAMARTQVRRAHTRVVRLEVCSDELDGSGAARERRMLRPCEREGRERRLQWGTEDQLGVSPHLGGARASK